MPRPRLTLSHVVVAGFCTQLNGYYLTITMESGHLLGGRYRIGALIGRGSEATVYRARDEVLQRDVAVKLFRDEKTDRALQRRQSQEAKILAGMSHHALVTLYDAGKDADEADAKLSYLVMELVHGADLRHRTARGPLTAAHMAWIGYDLADGLSYIHHHGIVHRDVKPANILLVDYSVDDRRPRAKLSDFGVAVMLDNGDTDGDGGTSGTPAYLSPEQAVGEPVGPPSDVYSLGLVLLEGLTGKMAYPGAPLQAAVARLLVDPDIPEELSPMWATLLTSMLARDPAARPPAREVSLALRQEIVNSTGRHRLDPAAAATEEDERMSAVERYRILDSNTEGNFDRVTALAAKMFSVPVAIVSIVDKDRIWFKSHHGTDVTQIDRDPGLCSSAILQDDVWVIKDAASDPRTVINPMVTGEFGLRFYAGVPLRTPDGHSLGTLCILDRTPRSFSTEEAGMLADLAAIVMNDLELRRQGLEAVAR